MPASITAAGAIVGIEQDGVVRPASGDQVRDVADADIDAPVAERTAGERRQRTAIPSDDFGHEFGDLDPRPRRRGVERGAQHEAHAEPADQNARRGPVDEQPERLARHTLLGGVRAVGHQVPAVAADFEHARALAQDEFVASGRRCARNLGPGFHAPSNAKGGRKRPPLKRWMSSRPKRSGEPGSSLTRLAPGPGSAFGRPG
ncbi:MAG: hypothetical protein V9G24_06905 [Rhodoblastus sp.]